MAHLSPQLHQLFDRILWFLCLLPIFSIFSLLIEIPAAPLIGLLFIAIAEGAWIFVKIPFPGTWQINLNPPSGEILEISIPRAHTQWEGIDIRVEPDLHSPQYWEIQVQFASGRKIILGPSDILKRPMHIDCQEKEGRVRFFGLQSFSFISFEDTHAWKDMRVAWLLRQQAQPWIIWGGVIMFVFFVCCTF